MSTRSSPSKAIVALRRRLDYLTKQPSFSRDEDSFRLGEMAALRVAIDRLEDLQRYAKQHGLVGRVDPEHEVIVAAIWAHGAGVIEGDAVELARLRSAVMLFLDDKQPP